MPEETYAKTLSHAALQNIKDLKKMSMMSKCTNNFLLGMWLSTNMYLLASACADTQWDTLVQDLCTLVGLHSELDLPLHVYGP